MTYASNIWNELSKASLLERLTFMVDLREIVSFIAGLVLLLIFHFFRRRDYKRTAHQLNDQLAVTNGKLTTAEANLDRARAETAEFRPSDWLKAAAKERNQGNEERAIGLIEDGFERIRTDLAASLVALAEHHLSLIVSDDPESHLSEGRRLAQLATELDPTNRDARFLMEESRLLAWEDIELVAETSPASYLPRDQEEANALIKAIIAVGQQLFDDGSYRLALQLFRRAELVARRAALTRAENGILASIKTADAMMFAGRLEQASEAIAGLLPICRGELDKDHSLTLSAQQLDAHIFEQRGHHRDARDKIERLLPTLQRKWGKEHPETLLGEHLRAQILYSLEQHNEALDAVQQLLTVRERVLGREHFNTLVTRFLKVQILDALGRYDAGLREVSDLEPVFRRIRGEMHPTTLQAGLLRAQLLHSHGEYRQACQAITDLLPVIEIVHGAEGADTILARHLHAGFLDSLGEHESALGAICDLLPLRERLSGPDHSDTLALRCLKAQALRSLGEHEQALSEVADLLPVVERVNGYDHSNALAMRHLRADLLRLTGEPEQALDVVTDVLSSHQRLWGKNGPRTVSTTRLKALILTHCNRAGEALELCSRLATLEAPHERAHTLLVQANAEFALGNLAEALEHVTLAMGEMSTRLAFHHYLLAEARSLQRRILDKR